MSANTENQVLEISRMIDGTYPSGIDAEAHLWRRCAKVGEEFGEVIEALLGMIGENPRKGHTHDIADVHKELMDVALAALGAAAHLGGNTGAPMAELARHVHFVHSRLRAALDPQTAADESGDTRGVGG